MPNIPAKSNRKWKPCFSKTPYRKCNQVERFFSKLKYCRRIATRYDTLADNFLAMVKLASLRLGLGDYESTAQQRYREQRPPVCAEDGKNQPHFDCSRSIKLPGKWAGRQGRTCHRA